MSYCNRIRAGVVLLAAVPAVLQLVALGVPDVGRYWAVPDLMAHPLI